MTAYQIKVTKLTGAHKGESFIMAKGGFVADEGTPQPGWMCYGSLKLAKAACTRLSKRNRMDYEAEQRNIKWRKENGKSDLKYTIYDLCNNEPIEVECYGKEG